MKTYYQGELLKHDQIDDADFPERASLAEAQRDVKDRIDSLTESERRGVTGQVTLWESDEDETATNRESWLVEPAPRA